MKKTILILAGAALAVASQAQVVMDQIGPNPLDTAAPNLIRASQDFEAVNNAFDVGMVDDFTVGGAGTNLVLAEFVGGLFGGVNPPRAWTNVTSYRVEIYNGFAAAGVSLTGNVASQSVASGLAVVNQALYPGDLNQRALIQIPVSIALAPGTYWVGIIPVMDFANNQGQTGVSDSSYAAGFPNNLNNVQANPGLGFGFGPTAARNFNSAYRLTGVPVPEPTTILAIGAGIAALGARRRRK